MCTAAVPSTLPQPSIAVNDPPLILSTSQACHSVISGQRPDSQAPITLTCPRDAAAAVKCSNEPVTSPYSVDPAAADTRDVEKTVTRSRPWRDEVTETGDRAQASNDATQASDLDDEMRAITSSYRHLLLDTPPSPILLSRQLTAKARFEPSAAVKTENQISSSNARLEKEDNGGESDKVKVTSSNYHNWLKESPPSPVLLSRQLNANYNHSTVLASSSATISYNSSSMAMSAASETANITAKKSAMLDDDLKSPFLLSRQLAFQSAAAKAAQTGRSDGDGTTTVSGNSTKTLAPSSPPLLRSRYGGDLSTPPSPILLSRMLVNNPPPAPAAPSFQPSIFTVTTTSVYTHSAKTNHSTASTAATPAAGRSVLTGGTWNSRRATYADTHTNTVSKTTVSVAPTFSDEENTARSQSKHLHRKSSRVSVK